MRGMAGAGGLEGGEPKERGAGGEGRGAGREGDFFVMETQGGRLRRTNGRTLVT